ncbi:hypothetical protein [Streptomyces reniochalinae]|uniref:hypothetical protein n=1 Tax=Streptomyces reniochalinae TaxID=2250578 RepID=UPI0015F01119|nr:hypothetical protein [Streptomyces reniochalinae]
MTLLILLTAVVPAAACLLVCLLTAVYLWSGDAARRTRAWRVLRSLLSTLTSDRGAGGS